MSIKNKKHLIILYFLKEIYLMYVLCILNSNLIRTKFNRNKWISYTEKSLIITTINVEWNIGLSGKFVPILKENWNAEDLNFSIHLLNYIG